MGRALPIDLDRSIPVPVRREEPPPSGPPAQLVQRFILILAATAAAAALLLLAFHPDTVRVAPVVLACGVLAALAALCLRAAAAPWLAQALTGLLTAAVAVMGLATLRLGSGLSAPALLLVPLLVCALGAVCGRRAALLLATASALVMLGVALVQPAAQLPPGWPAVGWLLLVHLLCIGVGLAVGDVLAQTLGQAVLAAHQREQRFRRLLSLAADAYWEIDSGYRLVAAGQHDHELRVLESRTGLGAMPWELPRFVCDADTLDGLMADLEIRAPFRDLPFSWRNRDGSLRNYLASGEPRFDARGVLRGYWGVARDVTAVQAARAELHATETRYQHLFARIPTPLVLHRYGQIIDANPVAVRLFGHAELADMLGTDLMVRFANADSRDRARLRMEHLLAMPEGAALPETSLQFEVQGKLLTVQATGVRVQADDGPAVLSIFLDTSERLAAQEALRRSQAMLSHVVDTSPDLITLTDAITGRYAMVNHAFERISGWSAAEAVGRTALELGVWGHDSARDAFLARLHGVGSVTDLPVSFFNRQGAEVAMRVSAARFTMDRREHVVINARDVSAGERDRMERSAILDNASIGIAVIRKRRFVLANPHFERIFGWAPGTLVGQAESVVWPHADDYAEVGLVAGPLLARGEPVALERTVIRQDGSTFTALVRGCAIDPTRPAASGTAWIAEDVTQRRQFEQALARARDDAEAANRAKSAFLANTSHELRTPLNGMIGLARMARAEGVSEALRQQYLGQIGDSAQSLAGIISDILDLSKIEAGKLQIETTAFDLGALLRTLEHTYQALAGARGLQLHAHVDHSLKGGVNRAEGAERADGVDGMRGASGVLGDPLRVRQIVTNFLSNALKFTASGSVQLLARRDAAGLVRIEVRDSGPGIDAPSLQRLFKPFTQADESTTRRFGGTGLGLSICRELALLMGGQVGVDSEVGQGSCFWVVLPLPPCELPQLQPLAPSLPGGLASLAGTRVLMVEDNAVNMMIAVAMLQGWGVHVVQAADGAQAVTAVQHSAAMGAPFDAVLMDVQMPVMSGHEATRALRQLDAGRHLPIIALTAAALVSERDEALRAGMDDFLTKPIDADKLLAALLRSCRSRVVP